MLGDKKTSIFVKNFEFYKQLHEVEPMEFHKELVYFGYTNCSVTFCFFVCNHNSQGSFSNLVQHSIIIKQFHAKAKLA